MEAQRIFEENDRLIKQINGNIDNPEENAPLIQQMNQNLKKIRNVYKMQNRNMLSN